MIRCVSDCQCPCCLHSKEACLLYNAVRRMTVRECLVVYDRIVVPFLMSFSALIPSLFPCGWVEYTPSREMEEILMKKDSLRGEYFRMCSLVSDWKKEFSSGDSDFVDASGFFTSLKCKGENLLCWVAARRRWKWLVESNQVHFDDYMDASVMIFRMRMQTKQINGVDVIYSRVYEEVVSSLGFTRSPLSSDAMCQFARDIGGVARMRELAVAFRHKFTASQCFRVTRYLSRLVVALDSLQNDQDQCLIAVAMALHPRLGDRSLLACVGGDILPRCVHYMICAPLCGLRDVLGKE